MGIDSNLAYLLGRTAQQFGFEGMLCTLGVQDLRAPADHLCEVLAAAGLPAPAVASAAGFYERLGFARVESVDVSDFEGCTHLVDLNAAGVPDHLRGRFDAVYNGGTLEHVFDLRAALRNVFELLKPGGIAVHVVPTSGWVDHGFYQFSPTLLIDYYAANGFDILEAMLLQPAGGPDACIIHTYVPGTPGGANVAEFTGRWLSYVTVRKRGHSTWDAIPCQSYYASVHQGVTSRELPVVFRPPFRIDNGLPARSHAPRYALPQPIRGDGLEWIARVPHLRPLADSMDGNISPLILFEDNEPIGPPHALHADIRERGRGRYSHWHDAVHFAPSRNDDANDHVYTYALTTSSGDDPSAVHKRVDLNRLVRWAV